jgi:hypothetical protein
MIHNKAYFISVHIPTHILLVHEGQTELRHISQTRVQGKKKKLGALCN